MLGVSHRGTPLSWDFRNYDYVNFDLHYFSYVLYYVVNNKLGGHMTTKEVMEEMFPLIESMFDQKIATLKSAISVDVREILKDNQMTDVQGAHIPELKTSSDAELDKLTIDILTTKSISPTAELLLVKGRNGRQTVVDTYSDVLADIKDEQDGRYKMRRKTRL